MNTEIETSGFLLHQSCIGMQQNAALMCAAPSKHLIVYKYFEKNKINNNLPSLQQTTTKIDSTKYISHVQQNK